MVVQQDFRELLRLLNVHDVEYVIVGDMPGDRARLVTLATRMYVPGSRCGTAAHCAALDDFGFASVGLTGGRLSRRQTGSSNSAIRRSELIW